MAALSGGTAGLLDQLITKKFSVPATYRNLLWKLLLGIVPVHIDSHQFVMVQRHKEYNDLIHALQVMRIIDLHTTKPQTFLAMWLLQTGKLKYDTNIQIEHGFVVIAQTLLQLFEDDTDVYWMAKGFYGIVEQFKPDIPKLEVGMLNSTPLNTWFEYCFAGIINETALAKIWDKLCGGGLLAKYVQIVLVVSAYWLVSILTVFINKTLLSTINLEAPLFITWYQCLTTVFICSIMKILHQYFPNSIQFPESQPFNTSVIKRVLPLSIMFTCMIATNNLCLKYVSVAFYYIGRSLTTTFNVIFTYMILGEKTSNKCIAFCILIIFGFFMGVDQENLAGSLSVSGTIFGIFGSLSLSLYSIYTKRILPHVNGEVWFSNNFTNKSNFSINS
ncbi:neuronally altered carbohydrate [Carabus blaptoides fortunei]